ncbi:MAG TPA: sugar efflux transporter [Polyangiaceae bacterium]|nr:sugar efflux transporter [Polyangiaceae bacterium]
MTAPSPKTGAAVKTEGAFGQIAAALTHLAKRRELRLLLLCNSVLGMSVSFVMPFMSLFCTREVGMSLALFGVFMTGSAAANIGISTWLAHQSDTRLSRRRVLLWASFAGAVGYAGYAFVREPWLLFVLGGGVLGLASLTFAQLFAYARELVERSNVERSDVPLYMNVFRMAFALAWTVGPAVAAFVLRASSFAGLFTAAAALYVLLFVLVFVFVEETPPAPRPAAAAPPARLRDVLARRDVLLWFAGLTAILGAHAMSINNMALLVLRVLHGSEADVGVIFSLAPVFELPFMLYVGFLATRVRSESLIRAAMLLAVAYYACLGCVQAPHEIYPLTALSAAIVSVTSGVAITFFQNKLPDQLGAATNLYSNASRLGSTSGYLLFGLVASRFGHRGTAFACALLALLALTLTAFAGSRGSPAHAAPRD